MNYHRRMIGKRFNVADANKKLLREAGVWEVRECLFATIFVPINKDFCPFGTDNYELVRDSTMLEF